VIIEDVDENPHRIDAMLTHLLNEGSIKRAAGILIGEMTRTDERVDQGIGGRAWREIVRERFAPLGIPMIIDYPFGHAPNMMTMPLGVKARLDANAGTLEYLESPCAS
jgi:muramoyltetrapeptide carboxypeptidase